MRQCFRVNVVLVIYIVVVGVVVDCLLVVGCCLSIGKEKMGNFCCGSCGGNSGCSIPAQWHVTLTVGQNVE